MLKLHNKVESCYLVVLKLYEVTLPGEHQIAAPRGNMYA